MLHHSIKLILLIMILCLLSSTRAVEPLPCFDLTYAAFAATPDAGQEHDQTLSEKLLSPDYWRANFTSLVSSVLSKIFVALMCIALQRCMRMIINKNAQANGTETELKLPRWFVVTSVMLVCAAVLFLTGAAKSMWHIIVSPKNVIAMEKISAAEDWLNGYKVKGWSREKILKVITNLEKDKKELDSNTTNRLGYLEFRMWDELDKNDKKYIKAHPQIYVDLLEQSAGNGYGLGQYTLATWYDKGHDYIKRDSAKASEFFKKSLNGLERIAKSDIVANPTDEKYKEQACLYVAGLYNNGAMSAQVDYEKALEYYRKYETYASYALHSEQIKNGIQKNIAKCECLVAEKYCNTGNRVHWDAILKLLESLESSREKDPDILDINNTKRLAYTEYRMFRRLDDQYCDEHQITKIDLLQQSADNNFPLAMHALGEEYQKGNLIAKNPTEANALLKRSIRGMEAFAEEEDGSNNILDEADKAYACYSIASHYHFGQFVYEDSEKALRLYEKVQNSPNADDFQDLQDRIDKVKSAIYDKKLFVVECYLKGDKTWDLDAILDKIDSLEAVKTKDELDSDLLGRLTCAQALLAHEIMKDDNYDSYKHKALKLAQAAKENGHPLAIIDLGILYWNGSDKSEDDQQQFNECIADAVAHGLEKFARDNSNSKDLLAFAWYGMGEAYRSGLGVEQDRKHALQCYKKAKSMGHNVPQWIIDEVK